MTQYEEAKKRLIKDHICERHLTLLEIIAELSKASQDASVQDVVDKANESYLKETWGFFKHYQTGKLVSESVVEDLENMHTRGFIYMDGEKICPTARTWIVYEQLYGKEARNSPQKPQ